MRGQREGESSRLERNTRARALRMHTQRPKTHKHAYTSNQSKRTKERIDRPTDRPTERANERANELAHGWYALHTTYVRACVNGFFDPSKRTGASCSIQGRHWIWSGQAEPQ